MNKQDLIKEFKDVIEVIDWKAEGYASRYVEFLEGKIISTENLEEATKGILVRGKELIEELLIQSKEKAEQIEKMRTYEQNYRDEITKLNTQIKGLKRQIKA